jgi:hypothetical protein
MMPTRNEKIEHENFASRQFIHDCNDFRHVAFVLAGMATDFAFINFPEGCNTIAEFVELCMAALLSSFSEVVGLEEIIEQEKDVYDELYMIMNFVLRYTIGEKRVSTKTSLRGAAFFVRYKEHLPRKLKKAITDFFKAQLVKANKGLLIIISIISNDIFINILYQILLDEGNKKLFNSLLKSVKSFGRAVKDDNDMETSVNVDDLSGLENIISPTSYNPVYFTMIYKDNIGVLLKMLINIPLKCLQSFLI